METTGRTWAVEDVVDLDRYPIVPPDGDGAQNLVHRCRAELRAQGACQLEGFMRPDAAQAVLAEARVAEGLAHNTEATHNAYFEDYDPTLPADHPLRLQVRSAKRAIGWNRIGLRSPLRLLYEWDGLTDFIRVTLRLPALYRDADPVGACSIMLYGEGGELGWHFDNSGFAVTLMLQGQRRRRLVRVRATDPRCARGTLCRRWRADRRRPRRGPVDERPAGHAGAVPGAVLDSPCHPGPGGRPGSTPCSPMPANPVTG